MPTTEMGRRETGYAPCTREGHMGKPHAYALVLIGLLLAASWFITERVREARRDVGGDDPGPRTEAVVDADRGGLVGGPAAPGRDTATPESAVIGDELVYTPEDVRIFRATMEWARENRIDTLALGDIIVRTGRRFVGEPYTPHTLELDGPERVVINLRELDCVTYVESVLALARLIRAGGGEFDDFAAELRRIRYRDGVLDGYTSRLHYFSEWIHDNEQLGLLRDITAELGGRVDEERIDFMSRNAEAYPSLEGRPDRVAEIREVERELSGRARHYIPQDRIARVASRIQDGDIIAATSSVEGLDVAHTGFALHLDGRLHLMHAPLVGRSLEISDQPLATRITRIDGQDGIMVARPR